MIDRIHTNTTKNENEQERVKIIKIPYSEGFRRFKNNIYKNIDNVKKCP